MLKKIAHYKLFRSIKGKISLFYLFYILLFSSIFLFIGYTIFSNIFMNTILNYTRKLVEETGRNIDSYLEEINMICSTAATNQTILSYIEMIEANDPAAKDNLWKVESFMQNLIRFNSKIRDIVLIDKKGYPISASGKGVASVFNFYEQIWFPLPTEKKSIVFTGLHHQNYYYENYGGSNETVSAVVPVYNFLNQDIYYGASLLCNLNIYELFNSIRNIEIEQNGIVILYDQIGNPIFKKMVSGYELAEIEILKKENKNQIPFFAFIGGKKHAVIYMQSKISQWTTLVLIPKNELDQHLASLKYISLIMILFMILIVAASYSFMNNIITRPIEKIISSMEKIEEGNFKVTVNGAGTFETELLSDKINSLVTNIVSLNRKLYLYEIKNTEAQLRALQSQINPHFLFNTLQLIKSTAVSEGNKETGKIITKLGNMLRYGIYHQEELVSIGDEINNIKDYLDIQFKRFPDFFSHSINCQPELENCKTIKLILQPIVENSINHNKNSITFIDIKINITEISNMILITIADTGSGTENNKLPDIKKYLTDTELEERTESIGLKNVHNRVFLKFGFPYGIAIYSDPGAGFKTEILIPKIYTTEEKI